MWRWLIVGLVVGIGGCGGAAVEKADRMNTFELMAAAAKSSKALEDAGFLFYAAEARYRIDRDVYPPTAKGDEDPGVLKASLSAGAGATIGRALANDPAAFKAVAARMAKWSPTFDAGYDPGWKYANELSGAAIGPVVAKVQGELVSVMEQKVKLLDNAEYRQLAEQASADAKIERQYWNVANEKKSVAGVPQDLRNQFEQAQQKHAQVAKRMKEIELATNPESRWYARVGWKAEDYFQDAKVVALCKAIEEDNVPEMERQIAAGANANAVGKDGMTPLLWAFPDRVLDRFECLLKHGADPNVEIKSDFGTKLAAFHPYPIGGSGFTDRGCHAGQSVTLLAARSPMIEYFNLVMAHGGDAKAVDGKTGEAALDVVLDRVNVFDAKERAAKLIASGADVNRFCQYHLTFPAMRAAQEMMWEVALDLLKAGADPKAKRPSDGWTLADALVLQDDRVKNLQGAEAAQRKALLDWLEKNGVSMEEARARKVQREKK